MNWEKRGFREELQELEWERQAKQDPWLPFSDVLDGARSAGRIGRKLREELYDAFAFTVRREPGSSCNLRPRDRLP
jgi:hypothetical protein